MRAQVKSRHKLSQAMQTHPDIALSLQSGKISPDFCRFYGGGIRHNEDIMHSFENFIVRLIPNYPPPLETRIWKLVVSALIGLCNKLYKVSTDLLQLGRFWLRSCKL